MDVKDILGILEDMGVAVFATVDESGMPHARHFHIGVANEQGIFFMTSPETKFFKQVATNPNVAVTAMSQEDYLIQVIRIEGKVRPVGPDRLYDLLAGNPYVNYVYPDHKKQEDIEVFQLYEGVGFYHSLTQGHKYVFSIGEGRSETARSIT
ncbi:pyridoxamine 5'-phosphate oxidase family protein [Streptococcus entericus]|uniref:pyridoxamine 5'-phosphate oxidase family protein n=1 Tax=Streptococcus entericus TaxID=155680 RepID=UPI00036B3F45|nr:pyridoxamine 5'-phosphate oxidase family protein [Streptococcus entericus]